MSASSGFYCSARKFDRLTSRHNPLHPCHFIHKKDNSSDVSLNKPEPDLAVSFMSDEYLIHNTTDLSIAYNIPTCIEYRKGTL